MPKTYALGDAVQTYSHPGESFTVIDKGQARMLRLRSADGAEFWISGAMVKPIAQDNVQE